MTSEPGRRTRTQYVIHSPCCRRTVTVWSWRIAYAIRHHGGLVALRCGSLLDTPGWRRRYDPFSGCGHPFTVPADEITAQTTERKPLA